MPYLIHGAAVGIAAAFVIAKRRGQTERWLQALEIATAISVAGALLALTSVTVLVDFSKAYLHAGRAVLADPSTLYDCTRAQCFVNIPIVAVLFVPLALMNPSAAGVVFSVAGAVLLVAAVRRLARGAAADIIVWLAILSGPIYYSVRIGNTTHMLLLPLMVAFDRLAAGRQAAAGAILAGLSLLKPPLALFLPFFLLRRNFRAAIAMAGCAAVAVAASVAFFGVELHWFWFREFVVKQGAAPIAAYNIQSVNGFVAHLLTRGQLANWYPVDAGALFKPLSAGLAAALVAAVGIAAWRAGPSHGEAARRVELWLVLCLTVLIAPIAWTHYYLLMLIPCAALVSAHASLGWRSLVGLVAAIALMAPPVLVLDVRSRIGNALYERILVSHYFLGGVVLLAVLIAERLEATHRDPGPLIPSRATE